MTKPSTRALTVDQIAKGKGVWHPFANSSPGGNTAPNAASGSYIMQIVTNGIGTVYPTTLVSFPIPTGFSNDIFLTSTFAAVLTGRTTFLAWIHFMGDLDCTGTGDKFTQDASVTYPLTRKFIDGSTDKNVTLIPLIYVTVAETTTAPIITLKTAAGGTGYVDQDGNNTVGTVTFTFPSTVTAVQSCYPLRLEAADSGITSMVAVQVNTAGATLKAKVYGMEMIAILGNNVAAQAVNDQLLSGCSFASLKPPTPTAGTLTSYLVVIDVSGTNTHAVSFSIMGAYNA
jgi:hypothetical protein